MRILLVTPNFSITGGAEYIANSRARLLARAGHQVYVLSSDGQVDVTWDRDMRSNMYFLSMMGMQTSLALQTGRSEFVMDAVQEIKPDVIDAHLISHMRDFSSWRKICRNAPVVFTVHNHCVTCPGYYRLLRRSDRICSRDFGLYCLVSAYRHGCNLTSRRLLDRLRGTWRNRKILRLAARLVTLNDFMAGTLLQAGFPRDKISIVPPSIYLPEFDNVTANAKNSANILFVGRFSDEKGIDLLLQALLLVKTPHRVTVVGGPICQPIKKLVQNMGLEGWIKLPGWVSHDELEQFYRHATVLALPSHWQEAFGLVGLEAASYGVPVVAFDVGGVSSWLRDGETGYLVPAFDVKVFAQRIEQLLSDRSMAAQMGGRGREVVAGEYSAERYHQAIIKVYKQAMLSHIPMQNEATD